MLRKKLAAEIGAGSTTVKVANEAPGDLAGGSMAHGGRVLLVRLGALPEGVPKLEQGRSGHCCLCPIIGHTSFYVKYNPKTTLRLVSAQPNSSVNILLLFFLRKGFFNFGLCSNYLAPNIFIF